MRMRPPSRTSPSLIRCCRNISPTSPASASSAASVSGRRRPAERSTATRCPSSGGKRRVSSSPSRSRSPRRRASERGTRRRASRFSACIKADGQAGDSTARALRSPVRMRARRTSLLDDLGLQGDLAFLLLQPELHRLPALVREDARGLLADELLEALVLHGSSLAVALSGLKEALVEGADGLGVALRVLDAELLGRASVSARVLGRGRGGRGGRRERFGLEPKHPEGLALLAQAELLGPQLVEGVVPRGQGLVPEALGVVADLRVRVPAGGGLQPGLRGGRRLLLDAAEELVPLDLDLPDRSLEGVEVFGEGHACSGLRAHEDPEEGQPELVAVGGPLAAHQDLRSRPPPHE